MPTTGTIFEEQATVLGNEAFAGEQYILRIHAPNLAEHARPGCFAHLQCDPLLAMRRPMSVMRTDPSEGTVEFLYKVVGRGTRLLSGKGPQHRLQVLGPIGRGFQIDEQRPRALLIGGGVGIPPMVFIAERMHDATCRFDPFVIMGSEVPFPFQPRPSEFIVPGVPESVTACMPLMERLSFPSRLASLQGYPGCYQGYVTELARGWLAALSQDQRGEVAIYACGPTPMLRATATLAAEYDLPCQVSLEEFMACAVGGCAGCVVRVNTPSGPAMKRVCVDGPVFEAGDVVWC